MIESELSTWAAPIAAMNLNVIAAALPKVNPYDLAGGAKAAACFDLTLCPSERESGAVTAALQASRFASDMFYATWASPPSSWKGLARTLESQRVQYQVQLTALSESIQRASAYAPLNPAGLGVDVDLASITSAHELIHLTFDVTQAASVAPAPAIDLAESVALEWVPFQGIPAFPPSAMVPFDIQEALLTQQNEIYALNYLLEAIEAQEYIDPLASDLWEDVWSKIRSMLFGSVVVANDCVLLAWTIISRNDIGDSSRTRLFSCYPCSVDAPRGPPWAGKSPVVDHQEPVFGRT